MWKPVSAFGLDLLDPLHLRTEKEGYGDPDGERHAEKNLGAWRKICFGPPLACG